MPERATTWRCFVAVPIPEELRGALGRAVAGWRSEDDLDASWTEPAGWHVTVHFIGAVDPDAVPQVSATLRSDLAGCRSFRVAGGGVGAFPSAGRARVLWYGVADPEGRLGALAHAVRASVERALPSAEARRVPETPFRGHVTLARLRRPARLREWLAGREAPVGTLPVTAVDLMRSHTGRGPAHYELLARAPLSA